MSSKRAVLTSQELEIMKIVWVSGASTVRDVYETLLERRKIAYTTVMTMMNILEQKGYLKKAQKDRAYVYQATRAQKQVIRGMVREFVDRVFNGSAEPLLVHLVEDRQVSGQDLEEIGRMLRESAGRKKP
ncbi:MAG TPA: BlaI/MecI/CopY family transcriptional regulator [Bryobacteraceae bacterium]|jgi:BlaI family transcriptional regulator, penicillinase repressor|nr:BlaI/MecI/CopY family transcriptional regulator [Bryobacteraceae bacterium]